MFPFNQSPKLAFGAVIVLLLGGLVLGRMVGAQSQEMISESANAKQGFALVELFTSQGCSSCPSADENLASITEQAELEGLKVITLSFHVDYWNYLGWKDPYSTADASQRQRFYARIHGAKQVYTPQMVVNGTKELLGSSREKSRLAIRDAIANRPKSSIQLTTEAEDATIKVSWKATGLLSDDMLNLALVQKHAEERIGSGENSGRTLKHVNVVRDFQIITTTKEEGWRSLKIPDGVETRDLHVVAYLQSPANAEIHGMAIDEIQSSN